MKRLRIWLSVLIAWIIAFYNIERLHEPINLASFVYIVAGLAGLAIIYSRRLQKLPLPWLLIVPTPVVLGLKAVLGYQIMGAHLPLTVTELCAVWVTIALARKIGQSLYDYGQNLTETLTGRLQGRSRPFAKGQAEMYRELRRARAFQRQVALLAVATEDTADREIVDRFLAQMEEEALEEYVSAQVGDLLASHVKDCDIIVRRNGHFLTLLAETDRGQATAVAERLTASARDKLGLDLKIGLSVFPDEEITLVGLLDRAEAALRSLTDDEGGNGGNGQGNGETPAPLTNPAP